MGTAPRFRFRSISHALRELEQQRTKSRLEEIINFVGLGKYYRQEQKNDLIKNKTDIINFVSRYLESNYTERNAEGKFIAEEIVYQAALSFNYKEKKNYPWDPAVQSNLTDLQMSLLVDGWQIKANRLVPVASEELCIAPRRSLIADRLKAHGYEEALRYLENIEKALEQGSWESANANCRTFLNVLFTAICHAIYPEISKVISEGEARKFLATNGFFRRSTRDEDLESKFVQSLIAMLGMEGAHGGVSTMENATFNYHLSILTADFFLNRFEMQIE